MNTFGNSAYYAPSGGNPYGAPLQTAGSFVAAPYESQQGFLQQGFQQQEYGGYTTQPYHPYGSGTQYLPQQYYQAPNPSSYAPVGLQMPRLPMPSVGSFTLNLDNGPLGRNDAGMYSGFGSGGSFAMAGPFAFYPDGDRQMEDDVDPVFFSQREKEVINPKKTSKMRDAKVSKKKQQRKSGCCV